MISPTTSFYLPATSAHRYFDKHAGGVLLSFAYYKSRNLFSSVCFCSPQVVSAILPRVQELNAFASVLAETKALEELPDAFFLGFSVILLTDCSEV